MFEKYFREKIAKEKRKEFYSNLANAIIFFVAYIWFVYITAICVASAFKYILY